MGVHYVVFERIIVVYSIEVTLVNIEMLCTERSLHFNAASHIVGYWMENDVIQFVWTKEQELSQADYIFAVVPGIRIFL